MSAAVGGGASNSMRSEAIDRDLLDEEARAVLDRVGKDDVVIFTASAKTR